MMDPHPDESLLLDYVAGRIGVPSDIDEHLAFCAECRTIVQLLREGGFGNPGAFDDLDLLATAPANPVVPQALLTAVVGAGRPEVAPHQLWRAAAPGTSDLVLVWVRRIHADGRPAVVPVTLDSEFADQYDLIVPADQSPLDVELVFHTTSEGSIDRRTMINCVADIDVAAEIDAVRRFRREGRRPEGLLVGTPIRAIFDERVEYRQRLTDLIVAMGTARFDPDGSSPDESHDLSTGGNLQDDMLDGLLDDPPLATLVREVRNGLAYSYPRCRLLPLSWPDTSGDFRPVATLLNIDVFVRLVTLDADIVLIPLVEVSRKVFDGDLSVQAVCFSSTVEPFASLLVDRRAVVEAYETPIGNLRPNLDDVISGSVVDALTKYFDRVVDPFRVVVSTTMGELNIDPRALAITEGEVAVDAVLSKATGFRIPGKSAGYRQLVNRKQLVISIVEQALLPEGANVRSILGEAS